MNSIAETKIQRFQKSKTFLFCSSIFANDEL